MNLRNSNKAKLFATITFMVALFPAAEIVADEKGNVALPSDFRSWTHTKSIVAFNKDDPFYGYRNIYANSVAINTLKNGGIYPDGSTLVMSFHVPVKNGDLYTQGQPIKYVVMHKDGHTFKATGGWGYEAYKAADKKALIGTKAADSCHACHVSGAAKADFVFSKYSQ